MDNKEQLRNEVLASYDHNKKLLAELDEKERLREEAELERRSKEATEFLSNPKRISEELDKLSKSALANFRGTTYTLDELRATSIEFRPLLTPFLPSVGIGAVVGSPDSGKSMFCRQLALSVAQGFTKFINLPLQTKHKRVIFITTEDTLEFTKSCFTRQSDAFAKRYEKTLGEHYTKARASYEKNLTVILADDLTTDEIMNSLEEELRRAPVDLVVIDAYGDVFRGGDGNSNISNRNSLRPFSVLAKDFETCILFVHHTNKGTKDKTPDHTHVQGGSGFVQKVRTVLEIRANPDSNIRYLVCTKGNTVANEIKANAIELDFDPESFLYKPTGAVKPIAELVARERGEYVRAKIETSVIFRNTEDKLRTQEIISRIIKEYGVSKATAERWIRESLQQVGRGVYSPK